MKLNIQLFADGEVIIPVDLDTRGFDRQIAKLEYELDELEETYRLALKDPDWDKKDLIDMEAEIQKTANKIESLKHKQNELNQTTINVGNGFKDSLKSLTKMGLAVFGIRSAYMLIRQSANQLAQSNDEVAGKLEAIKGSLANAIAPIAEVLVNLVYRLLSYLNAITKTFFGVDLFKKTAKSAKSAVGSANKLKKTLAGFDEMNVLNDNSSSGGGGGGGSADIKPIDTSGFEKWVEDLRAQWEELLAIDREEAKKLFLQSGDTWGMLKLGWFDTIQGIARIVTGFIDIFKGVYDVIKGIAEGNNEKIKESVKKLGEGIVEILWGLVQSLLGSVEMIVGAVVGAGATVGKWIHDNLIIPIGKWFKDLWNGIVSGVTTAVSKVKSAFNTVVTFFSNTIAKIKAVFKEIGSKAGEIVSSAFKAVVNGVLKAMESILNTPIKAINKLTDVINKVPGINLGKLNTFNLPRLAKGGIINMPGRGIPLATGGERGAEGVIPLTESQQMALLGEAIGKYISINATVPVYVGNRQIARELRKIEAEDAFAGNR